MQIIANSITHKLYSISEDSITPYNYSKNNLDHQYLSLVSCILTHGTIKDDRTKVGTKSITSYTIELDISTYFPLLTVKKTNFISILDELLWFLSGSTNTANLNTRIWDANSTREFLDSRNLNYPEGYIGPAYGYQMRGESHIATDLQWRPKGVDQIQYMIDEIHNNPSSRRILMSNWDVRNIKNMALPPCHVLFQIIVRGDYLDGIMYQRSADVFLGVPFNIASYALLLYIIANITDKNPGQLIIHFGDAHLYSTHLTQAQELLSKPTFDLPQLKIDGKLDINNLSPSNFELINYQSGKWVKVPMAV